MAHISHVYTCDRGASEAYAIVLKKTNIFFDVRLRFRMGFPYFTGLFYHHLRRALRTLYYTDGSFRCVGEHIQ